MLNLGDRQGTVLASALLALAIGYVGWKIFQSPNLALQFTMNGLSVGAVYALLALGFTIVYSTVWFFDLYYGAAAAMGPTASSISGRSRLSEGSTRSITPM